MFDITTNKFLSKRIGKQGKVLQFFKSSLHNAGVWERLWEKSEIIWMPEKMCFSLHEKSENRVLWRAKTSEIRLKSELSYPWQC